MVPCVLCVCVCKRASVENGLAIVAALSIDNALAGLYWYSTRSAPAPESSITNLARETSALFDANGNRPFPPLARHSLLLFWGERVEENVNATWMCGVAPPPPSTYVHHVIIWCGRSMSASALIKQCVDAAATCSTVSLRVACCVRPHPPAAPHVDI